MDDCDSTRADVTWKEAPIGARFFDRQDTDSPLNGALVSREDDVDRLLRAAAGRAPFLAELVGDQGQSLMIGIGPLGCAQINATDGSGSAEVAVARGAGPPATERESEHVEFLIGGTATPVPRRWCVPLEVVRRIAVEFVQTGRRSQTVDWEVV